MNKLWRCIGESAVDKDMNLTHSTQHRLKLDEWWHAQASIVAQAWTLEDGEWRWQGLPAQEEEEQRKKEKHRAAVVEKARVREAMERQGEVFDDKAYDREHPEAT